MDCGRIKCTSSTFRPISPVNTTVSTLNHPTSFLPFLKVITHIFRKSAQRIYLFEFKRVRRHPLLVIDKHILFSNSPMCMVCIPPCCRQQSPISCVRMAFCGTPVLVNQIMNPVGYDFDFGCTCHFNVTLIGLRLQGKGRR